MNQGYCLDHDASKLSRDLWGYLNLNIPGTSRDRTAFDNAVGGNGLDAWRRLLEPLGPNTESRLFEMHRVLVNPKSSKNVHEVLRDLDVWEGERDEYYRCGGEKLTDMTEIMTAQKILPANLEG